MRVTNAVLVALVAGCSHSTTADTVEPELRTKPDSVFHPETGELIYVLPPKWNPAELESVSEDHSNRRAKLASRLAGMGRPLHRLLPRGSSEAHFCPAWEEG